MNALDTLHDTMAELSTIDLASIQQTADLQTRIDRKYILDPAIVAELIAREQTALSVLCIDDRRRFRYESTYFDTPALDSYLSSAHGRRRRFKVRTRSYLDSGATVLEVKRAGGRGHTVKERLGYDPQRRDSLNPAAREFLLSNDIEAVIVDSLQPTLTTTYRRSTVLANSGFRFTIDSGLVCTGLDGRQAILSDQVLVETKSVGPVTELDRLLWQRGIRPVSVSKYCTGLAAVMPELPANKWNTTLRKHFDWSPLPRAA